MELLQVIALLCNMGADSSSKIVEAKQLKCQKYYIKCMRSTKNAKVTYEPRLERCILQKDG